MKTFKNTGSAIASITQADGSIKIPETVAVDTRGRLYDAKELPSSILEGLLDDPSDIRKVAINDCHGGLRPLARGHDALRGTQGHQDLPG